MMQRRAWYDGVVIIGKTSFRLMAALRSHRLGSMIPFVAYLLLGAVILWLVNTVAPLAPFVYSLF
jgi:hypothetical protein